jgi:hypothetical protein
MRQWVLSLPRWARFLLARDPKLITCTLQLAMRSIFARLTQERLSALPDGRLAYRVKRRLGDGREVLILERRELLRASPGWFHRRGRTSCATTASSDRPRSGAGRSCLWPRRRLAPQSFREKRKKQSSLGPKASLLSLRTRASLERAAPPRSNS